MRAVFLENGTVQVRPSARSENWTLRLWYEEWRRGAASLELSFFNADGSVARIPIRPHPDQPELKDK